MLRTAVPVIGSMLVCSAALCSSMWDEYLSRPDSSTASSLIEVVNGLGCDFTATPSSQQVATLSRLLTSGSRGVASIRPAFVITRCLDGGDLEDLYRALGKVLVERPKDVLRELGAEQVSETQLRFLVATLPLSLVDNLNGQIAELDLRAARVKSANHSSTAELSRRILQAIAERRNELVVIRAQTRAR